MAKTITVTSGKGGVGKTNFSVNLAVWLAQQGYKTCLFDADLGLANVNILLGIYPEYTLEDVIEGRKSIKEIVIKDKSGIDIIPGSSGVAKMVNMSEVQLNRLADTLKTLNEYDYFIFDTSAGISKNVVAFCMSSQEVILLITPEPTSLTDAYSLLKILKLNGYQNIPKIVVNQCKDAKIAQFAYGKLKETTRKFLKIKLAPLGTVVTDSKVLEAVTIQKPFISVFPSCKAARCIKTIAKHILKEKSDHKDAFELDSFWNSCFNVFTGTLKMPTKKKTAVIGQPPAVEPKKDQHKKVEAAPPDRPEGDKAVTEEHQKPSTTEKPAPSAELNSDNQALFSQLVNGVTSISKELSAIRQLLEKGSAQDILNKSSNGQKKDKIGTPIIPLDFEAFIADQKVSSDAD